MSWKYGQISLFERIKLVFTFLPLPVVTLWCLLLSPFNLSARNKTWRRVMADTSFRYISSALSVPQMQAIMGSTLDVCLKWGKQNNVDVEIDEIGDGARLIWIGKRRTDRVLFYIHGGTYCLPIQDFGLSFWNYVVHELKERHNLEVGFVALNYSLVPEGYFPTQLTQATRALNHLLSLGIPPSNIQIAGESAGGGLIFQLLSHILHPAPSIPLVPELPSKIASIILLSPWVALTTESPSFTSNSDSDVLPAYTWEYLGKQYLSRVSDAQRPYVEPLKAPERWFTNLRTITGKILLVAGEHECLRDDVIRMGGVLKGVHDHVEVVVQEGGVHNDVYLDFLAGEKVGKGVTDKIVQTMVAGFM